MPTCHSDDKTGILIMKAMIEKSRSIWVSVAILVLGLLLHGCGG